MDKIQLRPFKESDWYGFAGAERPEGGEPMVGDIEVDGFGGQVVVSKDRVEIYTLDDKYNPVDSLFLETPFVTGKNIISELPKNVTIKQLFDMGFQKLFESKIKKAGKIIEGVLREVGETHMAELFHVMLNKSNEMTLLKSNYTADGIEAVIEDMYDKKFYRVTIAPAGDTF